MIHFWRKLKKQSRFARVLDRLFLFVCALWLLAMPTQPSQAANPVQLDSVIGYTYDRTPSGYVCGTTGPSPNQMQIRAVRKENGRKIEFEVEKCDRSDFRLPGRVELLANGAVIAEKNYSAGDFEIEFLLDPVTLTPPLRGFNDYQAYVFSQDQPTIPKHTGVVRVWEKYDTPADQQHGLVYSVNPERDPQCGNLVALELLRLNGGRQIEAVLSKCDGNNFAQGGSFYLAANDQPFLGPISFSSGQREIFHEFDPMDYGLATESHTYKAIVYTADQPTLPKISGGVAAMGQQPTPTRTPTATATETPVNTTTPTPTATATATIVANTSTPTPTATTTLPAANTPTATATSTSMAPQTADVRLEAETVSGRNGATVTLLVKAQPLNGRALSALALEVRYDPSVAEAIGCTEDPDRAFGSGACNPNFDTDRSGADAVRVSVASAHGVTSAATVARIDFRLVGQAGSGGPVTLHANTVTDGAGRVLPVELSNGRLTVVEPGAAPTLRFVNGENSGGPGSHFLLVGEGFPANSSLTIFVNETTLITLTTDASGRFYLLIITPAEMPAGNHTVTTSGPGGASAGFAITQSAPLLRPSDPGDGTVWEMEYAPGAGRVFLPLVIR